MMREQMLKQQMMEQAMRQAQQQRGGQGQGYDGRALTKKQKKELEKRQAAAAKQQAKVNKAHKAAASKRQKAYSSAQRSASKRGGAGMVARPKRGGPLGFIVSIKGAALIGLTGYMYIAQRELLLRLVGMGLKYPLMIAKALISKAWALLIKPILRKLIRFKGSGAAGAAAGAAAGGELPGGAY